MIIRFNPLFKEKIWGGNRLHTLFNYDIPSQTTGECWGISAHDEGANTIKEGPYQGMTLKELWENHRDIFGNKEGTDFPILIKLIDATDDLSIQVHPSDDDLESGYGKTECWYILDAKDDSEIIIGHKASSKAQIRQALQDNTVEEIVNHHPIQKGDFFFIDAGTLHAIKKDTLLLEIQQSSDVTYRFYDYNRRTKGQLRPLHVEDALDVVKVPDNEVKKTIDIKYFDVDILTNEHTTRFEADQYGDYIIVIEGEGTVNKLTIQKGDFFMVSAESDYTFTGNFTYARVHMK